MNFFIPFYFSHRADAWFQVLLERFLVIASLGLEAIALGFSFFRIALGAIFGVWHILKL